MTTRNKTKIEIIRKENYEMLFAGKMRTFDYVNLSISPFDGNLMMSAAEHSRLGDIIAPILFDQKEPLTVDEVMFLTSHYKIYRHEVEENISKHREYAYIFSKSYGTVLSTEFSDLIKRFVLSRIGFENIIKMRQKK